MRCSGCIDTVAGGFIGDTWHIGGMSNWLDDDTAEWVWFVDSRIQDMEMWINNYVVSSSELDYANH